MRKPTCTALALAVLFSLQARAQYADGRGILTQISATKESPNVAFIGGNVYITYNYNNYYSGCAAQGPTYDLSSAPYSTESASLSIHGGATYLTQPAPTAFGNVIGDRPNLLDDNLASDAMPAFFVSPPPGIDWNQSLIQPDPNTNKVAGADDPLKSFIQVPLSVSIFGITNSSSAFTALPAPSDPEAQIPQWLLNAYSSGSSDVSPQLVGFSVATSLDSALYAGPQGITLTTNGQPPVSIYDAFSGKAAQETPDFESLREAALLYGDQNHTQDLLPLTYSPDPAQKTEFGLGSASLNDELSNLQNSGKKVVSWSVVYEADTTPTVPAAQ
jgi:hypothetical protein